MTTIVLPDHHLIRHPTIIPTRKVPTFHAEGGFSRRQEDLMRITFYGEVSPAHTAREIAVIIMSRTDFERSMVIEAIEFMPDLFGGRALH